MVAFGPAKGGCASKTSAENMGIVCDGPGIKVTSTSAYAYECCMGDKCNTEMSANVSGIEARLSLVLPSKAYCSSDEGARYTHIYICTCVYACICAIYVNIHLYKYVYIHVYIYVWIYVYIHVLIYVYTHV